LLPDTMHANASAASAASFKSPYHHWHRKRRMESANLRYGL